MTKINELQEQLEQDTPEFVEEQNADTEDYSVPQQSELQYLKQVANRMGISYPNNITVTKLKAKINEHTAKANAEAGIVQEPQSGKLVSRAVLIRDEAHKLIRFQLVVNNPNKQRWTGEYFTAGNEVIGHVTRFIPFNAEGGIWHAEKIILELMKKRKYTMIPEVRSTDRRGKGTQDYNRVQLLPEFTIIELPPLTQEELLEMRARQDATGAIDNE